MIDSMKNVVRMTESGSQVKLRVLQVTVANLET